MQTQAISSALLEQILSGKFQTLFWSHIEIKGPDECWPWKASRKSPDGYGQVGIWHQNKRINRGAHKVAWISANKKDVPDGLLILHSCKNNKPCCNPAHLRPGTKSDNGFDSVNDGSCYLKNATGESHPASKLTKNQVIEIRALRKQGVIYRVIADRVGATLGNVASICRGKSWTHI